MCPKKLKNVSRCGEEVPPTKKKKFSKKLTIGAHLTEKNSNCR
jgi:hypothetical protein